MIRILHVDDNPEDQEIIKYNLQHHAKDFEIEWAGMATEALQALDGGVFDCILCDYQMPKVDGLELLRKLRGKGDETPFIFLTCQGSEEVAAQALRAGAGDYFTKDVGFVHYERIANSIRRVAAAREQVLQQRRTEKALRESEEWFRALTESTSDWIWEVDVNGVYTYAGPRIKDLLGYELDEIVGKTPFDLMPPQVATLGAASFRETVKSREPIVGLENVKLHKDGREVALETSGVPIFGTDGKLSGYRGVDRDISERKRSEKVRESIYRISEAANAAKYLQELFSSIHGVIGELMPAENFYIALYDHDSDMLNFSYFVDQFDETPAPKKLGKGLTEYVLRTGKPLLATPDVFDRLVEKGEVEPIGAPSIDWLGVPLGTPEETIGVLVVQTYTEGVRYGEEEARILEFVSAQAAMAIERKRTEEALHWREEEYKTLNNQLPIGVYRTTAEGRFLHANPALATILGYESVEDLKKVSAVNIYDDPDARDDQLAQWRDKGGVVSSETRLNTKKGKRIWVQDTGRVFLDENGEIDYVDGAIEDITERKRAEEALRESEANYSELANSITDVFFAMDRNLRYTYWNRASENLTGISAKDAIGKSIYEIFTENKETEKAVSFYRKALKTRQPQYFVNEFQLKGKTFFYEISVYPSRNGLSVFVKDITERKQAEEALRESEERFRTQYKSLPIPTYTWQRIGEDIVLVDYNDAALMSTQGNVAKSIGVTAKEMYKDMPEIQEELSRCLTQKTSIEREMLYSFISGESKYLAVKYAYVPPNLALVHTEDITERKRAEEKLRVQQAILRLIIDTNPNCIFTKDRQGRFTLVNKATAEVFGTTVENLTGRTELEFTDRPDEVRRLLKDDLEVIESLNEKIIPEEKLTVASGQVRFYQTVKRPLIDKDGNANQVLGIATDITERKKAEETIRKSEERYRKLFEHAREGIFLADAITGEIIDCNRAAANLVERSKADLIGQHQTILHPPGDTTDGFSKTFKKHIEDSEGEVLEARVITSAGKIKDVDIKANLLDIGDRKLLQGMFRDVTERKRSDEAIMEKATRLELIAQVGQSTTAIQELDELLHQAVKLIGDTFDYVNVIIMLVDGDYLVLRATTLPSIQTLEGRLRLRVGSEGITGWVAGNGEPLLVPDVSLDARYYSVLEAMETKSELAVPIKLKGKVIGVLDTQSTELNTFSQADIFTLQTIADQLAPAIDNARLYEAAQQEITERKLAEEELKKSHDLLEQRTKDLEAVNKELEAFGYSVSHDLRAPLRHISGFSQALMEDYADKLDEEGGGYLQKVIASSNQMSQLIDNLLRLSRLTSGELNFGPVDLSALARTVAEKLQSSKPERKVGFEIADGLVADADMQLMQILLENLLGNAWKFTGKNKDARIEFGATEREGKREFFVKDNGVGFDPAYADKVFVAFQRIHTGSEFKGSGIGLATVQRIVHRHGGRVWAESEVGKGATFHFTVS